MSSPVDAKQPLEDTRSAPNSPARLSRYWLEVALIFAVFFVAGGAPVPHVNETHYLAKAKQYWQPEWCQGDLFLESGKAHLTFYWTVGVLTKWFELPTVAWIGRIAAWLALAFAWQRLSRSIITGTSLPFHSGLTAMLLVTLIDWTNFAGEWVIGGVEGKCFAYACVFWGMSALATGRWKAIWPWLGLGASFHVLVGGWAVVVSMMVWLSVPRGTRPTFSSMLPMMLLGGVLAIPGVLPALQLTQGVSPETVEQANQIYVFDRLPHHLSPLTMRENELIKKATHFSLLLVGFVLLRFLCLEESVASESKAHCFRPLDLIMRFALGSLAISVAGLLWEFLTWNHPALAARVLKYYLFRLADIAIPVAVCLSIGWLANAWSKRLKNYVSLLLLLAVTLPGWYLVHLSWERYQNPLPPAIRKMKNPAAWLEACQWVRKHTPQHSLFLVPRRAQSFKWYAERSDLVTWKDVPQSADALLIWRDRYHDVHRYVDDQGNFALYRSLAFQGTQRIRELADTYQLDYVLTTEYPPLDLPIVYANRQYVVYATAPQAVESLTP